MYYFVTIEDTVRIPPNKLGDEIEKVILSELEESLVGRVFSMDDTDLKGAFVSAHIIKKIGEGRMLLGDAGVFYSVLFDAVVDAPALNEMVEGDVREVREFGPFVNIGVFDGLCHVSQIMEDYISYDGRNSILVGKETRNAIKVGDVVKARIISLSLKENTLESKIGLTMRQPYLGKAEWLKKDKSAEANKEKPEAKESGKGKEAKKTKK